MACFHCRSLDSRSSREKPLTVLQEGVRQSLPVCAASQHCAGARRGAPAAAIHMELQACSCTGDVRERNFPGVYPLSFCEGGRLAPACVSAAFQQSCRRLPCRSRAPHSPHSAVSSKQVALQTLNRILAHRLMSSSSRTLQRPASSGAVPCPARVSCVSRTHTLQHKHQVSPQDTRARTHQENASLHRNWVVWGLLGVDVRAPGRIVGTAKVVQAAMTYACAVWHAAQPGPPATEQRPCTAQNTFRRFTRRSRPFPPHQTQTC